MSDERLIIVNGAAGGGRCRARFDAAHGRLREIGLDGRVALTEGPGHATELARDAFADGVRNFLTVGGDGTNYEVVNGLFPEASPGEVILGVLPLGTGNSFLRDFDITTTQRAFAALERGETRPVDVVRIEHAEGVLHYMNLLGIGFLAEAGSMANDRFKVLGAGGYVAAVVLSTMGLHFPRDPHLVNDDEEPLDIPAAFLSFNNSKFTGGAMMMAPEADPTDGKLDVIRVGELSKGAFVGTFPKIFQGTHVDHPAVEQYRARRITFTAPRRQPCMIDGEIIELEMRSLEVIPGALQMIL